LEVVVTWFLSILFSIALWSAPARAQEIKTVVDPHFQKYYSNFLKLSKKHHCVLYNKLLSITFDSEETFKARTVGLCYFDYAWRQVTIKESYWQSIGEFQRQILVFHELGHCLLNREHDEKKFDESCPGSLMNHEVVSSSCSDLKQVYFNELFHVNACR
jgi:hypothetical protein